MMDFFHDFNGLRYSVDNNIGCKPQRDVSGVGCTGRCRIFLGWLAGVEIKIQNLTKCN